MEWMFKEKYKVLSKVWKCNEFLINSSYPGVLAVFMFIGRTENCIYPHQIISEYMLEALKRHEQYYILMLYVSAKMCLHTETIQ
jgi:hypothetical protein